MPADHVSGPTRDVHRPQFTFNMHAIARHLNGGYKGRTSEALTIPAVAERMKHRLRMNRVAHFAAQASAAGIEHWCSSL